MSEARRKDAQPHMDEVREVLNRWPDLPVEVVALVLGMEARLQVLEGRP